MQRKCQSCQASSYASDDIAQKLREKKGVGSPLPSTIQAKMEQGFGTDFSRVRVHTGTEAAQLNQQLGAKAFTYGPDVYFNQGEYQPASSEGQRLLAHELTHVVQQNRSVEQKIMRVPRPTAPADLNAYSAATRRTIVFDVPAPVPRQDLQDHFDPNIDETPRAGFDIDYIFPGTLSGITWLQKPLKSIARAQFKLMGRDTDPVLVNTLIILPLNLSSCQNSSATPPTPSPNTRFRMTCTEFDRTGRGASAIRNVQIIIEDIGQPTAVPNAGVLGDSIRIMGLTEPVWSDLPIVILIGYSWQCRGCLTISCWAFGIFPSKGVQEAKVLGVKRQNIHLPEVVVR